MTPEVLAEIHALCFPDGPRPWSAEEFASLLASRGVRLLETDGAFLLYRLAGPEAELLTIAVHPDFRRRRIASELMARMHAAAAAAGAEEIFLEVSEQNAAARALYQGLGYAVCGRRKGYYIGPNGQQIAAILMRRPLGAAADPT